MEIFVPDYEWNSHWKSVDEAVGDGKKYGDFSECDEFKMVRITVGACTTYRIVDGKPVPIKVAFPDGLPALPSNAVIHRAPAGVRWNDLLGENDEMAIHELRQQIRI